MVAMGIKVRHTGVKNRADTQISTAVLDQGQDKTNELLR